MRARLDTAARLLLLLIFPVAFTVAALHLWEVSRSGLAQLPVYAAPSPDGSGYPVVGGYRMETESRDTVLRPGDRLIRIGQRDLRGVGHVRFDAIGLAAAGPRGEALLVYERDGVRHTTSLPAVPHPYPWSRLPNLLLLPICALVLLRAPQSRDAQRFSLAFTLYAMVQLQFYGGPAWQTLASLWVLNAGSPIAVVVMLRFARLFPNEVPDAKRVWWGWPWLAGASYLLVRISFLGGWPLPPEEVQRVSHACHAIYLLGTIAILGRNYAHAEPVGRRRLKWVLLGAALGSLPLMVVQVVPLVLPDWSGFERAFALGTVATGLWMVGLVVAVLRFNVFDIDRLLGATATLSIVAALGLAALVAGVPFLADRGSASLGIDEPQLRLALAMLLAAALVPLAQRLRPRVDGLLVPERAALENGVQQLLEELSQRPDPGAVVERACEGVLALLRPVGSALYVRAGDGLRLERADGLRVPEAVGLAEPWLARHAAVLPSAQVEPGAVAFTLPFRDAAGPVAVLVLGAKRSGDVYTSTDRSLLGAVAAKVSSELLRFAKDVSDREARTKSRLLATASHDIRQPLHALGFMVETLSGKVDSDEARALIASIQSSTRDLSAMLGDLLDLSKIENGAVPARKHAFPLAPLLEHLAAELAPLAEQKGLALRVAAADVLVESDRTLLARILRNLLANALRYTQRGRVTVSARAEGDGVWIDVADTGPGIAEERQREIFQEFRQLEANREGIGLGLAIVDGLARLLGHELAVRSTPGEGSVFSIRVPQAAARGRPETVRDSLRPLLEPLRGRRVAVIDDDPVVLEATRQLLLGWGCQVRTAAGGGEAGGLLLEPDWSPEFVLSDYRLGPGGNGVEVIERLRRDARRPIPAALVTGSTDPADLDAMRAAGLPVLQKPLAAARLRAVLTQALAGARMERGSN